MQCGKFQKGGLNNAKIEKNFVQSEIIKLFQPFQPFKADLRLSRLIFYHRSVCCEEILSMDFNE